MAGQLRQTIPCRRAGRNVDHEGTANFLVNRRMNNRSRCGGREMTPICCFRFVARSTMARSVPGLGIDLIGLPKQIRSLLSRHDSLDLWTVPATAGTMLCCCRLDISTTTVADTQGTHSHAANDHCGDHA
jgi:hypothetical protein